MVLAQTEAGLLYVKIAMMIVWDALPVATEFALDIVGQDAQEGVTVGILASPVQITVKDAPADALGTAIPLVNLNVGLEDVKEDVQDHLNASLVPMNVQDVQHHVMEHAVIIVTQLLSV